MAKSGGSGGRGGGGGLPSLIRKTLLSAYKAGENYAFVTVDGREGIIPVRNLSRSYLESMTMRDLRRNIVR